MITGTCIRKYTNPYTETYTVTLNPGWNYLVQTITSINSNTYTNEIPSNTLKWYYVDYPDVTPPTVSLLSSSINLTTVGSVTLTATATDDKGVTKVEFYDAGIKIGEDLTAPYEQTVNLLLTDNGTKFYTAKAFDAANNSTSSNPLSVTVNIQGLGNSPTVSGQIFNWMTTPYGTGSVKFLVNTNPPSNQNSTVGTATIDSTGNFSVVLLDLPAANLQTNNAGSLPGCNAGSTATFGSSFNGAVAFTEISDSNGKVIGRTGLTNSLAAMSNFTLSAPAGTKLGYLFFSNAPTTITGTCITSLGSSTYNVIINPGWNYLIQTIVANFTYTTTSGTLPADVHWYYADLPDMTPPTVNLSSSSTNVTADGTITLTATASDNVGVTKVEFYEGSTKIAEDLIAPFEHAVNLSASDNGSKYYGAKAFDAAGNSAVNTTTLVVNVNIPDIIKPNVSLSSSSNSVSIVGPITLFANATDNVGVSKVEFYNGATKLGEDFTAPFEQIVNLARADNGSKNYGAVAFDTAGNSNNSNLITVIINMVGLGNNPSISGHIANWTTTSFGTGSIKFGISSGVGSSSSVSTNINSNGDFNLILPDPFPVNLFTIAAGIVPGCQTGSNLSASHTYKTSYADPAVFDSINNPIGVIGLANSIAGLGFFPIRPINTTSVLLQYSDSSTILSGNCINTWGTTTYNVILNPGWNYLTTVITGAGTSSITSGTLPGNVQWFYADTIMPTVFLASDSINVTTAGSIKLTATATDNIGVTKVVFYDITSLYINLGEDSTAPYEQVVNFTSANNGTRMYHAVVYDAAGNSSTSGTVFVTVAIP
jgi:Bacterial Ig domain